MLKVESLMCGGGEDAKVYGGLQVADVVVGAQALGGAVPAHGAYGAVPHGAAQACPADAGLCQFGGRGVAGGGSGEGACGLGGGVVRQQGGCRVVVGALAGGGVYRLQGGATVLRADAARMVQCAAVQLGHLGGAQARGGVGGDVGHFEC